MTWEELSAYCCQYYGLHESSANSSLYRKGEDCKPNGRIIHFQDNDYKDYYTPVVRWGYGFDTTRTPIKPLNTATFNWTEDGTNHEKTFWADERLTKETVDEYMRKAGLERDLTLF